MFVVTVEFVARPEHAAAFTRRVRQQAQYSLAREPDCRVFDVCIDRARPERIFLYEVYSDENAFRVHLESGHFKAFDTEVAAWVAAKNVATFNRLE